MAEFRPSSVKARTWLLLAFVATTYPVAPVIGFGWLLAILGYVQCETEEYRARLAFLALFALLHLCVVPWGSLLGS